MTKFDDPSLELTPKENDDLKVVLDYLLEYNGALPNTDKGGSGDVALNAAERLYAGRYG